MKNTIKLVSVILLAIAAAFGVSAVEITDFSQITDMEVYTSWYPILQYHRILLP